MNIDTRSSFAFSNGILASMGPEAMVQALVHELGAAADEARHQQHEATEARFDQAEAAIESSRDAARAQMIGGVLSGVCAIGQGVTGAVVAARPRGADSSGGSETASESQVLEHSRRSATITAVAGLATPAAATVGSILGARAAAASSAGDTARLASDRARERADEGGRTADREQSIRDQLARQLEELMRQRHRIDDVALGAPR